MTIVPTAGSGARLAGDLVRVPRLDDRITDRGRPAVVLAKPPAVLGVRHELLVELGRLLDLVLAARDVHLALLVIDPLDGAGRQHYLRAEDPSAGVDDQVAAADLVGR